MSLMFHLIRHAVDYAGLFPPANLGMNEVVNNYADYLRSHERTMLGRLIVPAMRLSELETIAKDLGSLPEGTTPWKISALVPPIDPAMDTGALDGALEAIESFNQRNRLVSGDGFRGLVDALEVKVSGVEATRATIERLPPDTSCFLEYTDKADPEILVEQISQVLDGRALMAKIRTGGVTPDLIPPPNEVARFIATCAKFDVGFKATAGLHHPIRGPFRLTYENEAPTSLLFGYLNVFVATMIAFEHFVSENILIEILANEDPERFVFEESQLRWDDLCVSKERVIEFRNRGIISFGSCSFLEPTNELMEIPNMTRESVFSP